MSQLAIKQRTWWQRIPLYLQIAIALILGLTLGLALGAGQPNPANVAWINNLVIPCNLVLKCDRAFVGCENGRVNTTFNPPINPN